MSKYDEKVRIESSWLSPLNSDEVAASRTEPVVTLNGTTLSASNGDYAPVYAVDETAQNNDSATLVDGKPAAAGFYTVIASGNNNFTDATAPASFRARKSVISSPFRPMLTAATGQTWVPLPRSRALSRI